jgi:hypothetical protein
VKIKEIENKKFLKIQGNIENIKGNYQAQIIGHGTEEDGVRKLNKKTGKTIAEELKLLRHVYCSLSRPFLASKKLF